MSLKEAAFWCSIKKDGEQGDRNGGKKDRGDEEI